MRIKEQGEINNEENEISSFGCNVRGIYPVSCLWAGGGREGV
jgi:hypothetical protein